MIKGKRKLFVAVDIVKGVPVCDCEETRKKKIWRDLHGTKIALLFNVTGLDVLWIMDTTLGSTEVLSKARVDVLRGIHLPTALSSFYHDAVSPNSSYQQVHPGCSLLSPS